MNHARTYLSLLAMLLIVGCETLGIAKPETFKEKLAVGYTTNTAIRQAATKLLEAKKITADEGAQVLAQTDNARVGLDIARSLEKANPTAADAKLTSIRTALTALQTYLASREK